MTHRGLGVIIRVMVKGRGCDSKGIKRGKTRNGRVSKNVAGKQTGAKMNLCEIQKQVNELFQNVEYYYGTFVQNVKNQNHCNG